MVTRSRDRVQSFRIPFPWLPRCGNGNAALAKDEAAVQAFDAAVGTQPREAVAEGGVASAERLSKSLATEWEVGRGEGGDNAIGEIGSGFLGSVLTLDHAQMGRGLGDQLQHTGWRRGCGAMFGRQDEMAVAPAEEEIAVAPGVQVARAPERLTVHRSTLLSQVVHQDERQVVTALEQPELGQECRDVRRRVLVETMKSHERVEDKKPGTVAIEGGGEPCPIVLGIESETVRKDEPEVESLDIDVARNRDGADAGTELCRAVLSPVEEDGAGITDREAAEGGSAAGDADREIEGEPGLAALGRAADEAHAMTGP